MADCWYIPITDNYCYVISEDCVPEHPRRINRTATFQQFLFIPVSWQLFIQLQEKIQKSRPHLNKNAAYASKADIAPSALNMHPRCQMFAKQTVKFQRDG